MWGEGGAAGAEPFCATSVRGGICVSQTGMRYRQRGANGQPGGSADSGGGRPPMLGSRAGCA